MGAHDVLSPRTCVIAPNHHHYIHFKKKASVERLNLSTGGTRI